MTDDFTLIDGKAVAADLRQTIQERITSMSIKPGLAVILVGDDPASHVYVGNKVKACEQVGIQSFEHRLPAEAKQEELLALVESLNNNPEVHGIEATGPEPPHAFRSYLPERP